MAPLCRPEADTCRAHFCVASCVSTVIVLLGILLHYAIRGHMMNNIFMSKLICFGYALYIYVCSSYTSFYFLRCVVKLPITEYKVYVMLNYIYVCVS